MSTLGWLTTEVVEEGGIFSREWEWNGRWGRSGEEIEQRVQRIRDVQPAIVVGVDRIHAGMDVFDLVRVGFRAYGEDDNFEPAAIGV